MNQLFQMFQRKPPAGHTREWRREDLDAYHRTKPELHIGVQQRDIEALVDLCEVALATGDRELCSALLCDIRRTLRAQLP